MSTKGRFEAENGLGKLRMAAKARFFKEGGLLIVAGFRALNFQDDQ